MKPSQFFVLLLNLNLSIIITLLSFSAAAAAAVPVVPSDFIRSSCRATLYPALCVQSLINYAPSVRHSPRQLAHAALNVSLAHAQSASAFIKQLSPKPDRSRTRSRQAGAIKDCLETMQDSVDQLRQSVQEMNRMGRMYTRRFRWHLSNVQTWVSAALTDANTCLDSISHNAGPTVRAVVRKRVVNVAQVTSNALALVNRLAPKY